MNCSLQAPLSVACSKQEYWSELSFPTVVDLPTQGLKLHCLLWQADSLSLRYLQSLFLAIACRKLMNVNCKLIARASLIGSLFFLKIRYM